MSNLLFMSKILYFLYVTFLEIVIFNMVDGVQV